MEAKIINVGNSKGIILPVKLMKLIGLKERVEINIEDNKIVISPAEKKPREGWEEMIKNEVESKGQPKRLIPDLFEDENVKEWEW